MFCTEAYIKEAEKSLTSAFREKGFQRQANDQDRKKLLGPSCLAGLFNSRVITLCLAHISEYRPG